MSVIRKADEVLIPDIVVGLIYGEPGIGKTTIALSAPKPLLIDTDGGVHRIQAEYRTDTVQVKSYQDILNVLEEDLNDYKSLVIDTFGNLVKYMLIYFSEKDPKLITKGGTYNIKIWALIKSEITILLDKIKSLKKNLILVAHQTEDKNEDKIIVRVKGQGSSKDDILECLDFMGYMEMVGKYRTISFTHTQYRFAKNSILLDELINVPELKEYSENNFITTEIIDKSIQRRLQEQQNIKIKKQQIKTTLEQLKEVNCPNEKFTKLKKLDICKPAKIFVFENIKQNTDMKWNAKESKFE